MSFSARTVTRVFDGISTVMSPETVASREASNDRPLASLAKIDSEVADPQSSVKQQPDYARNEARSIKPEILVLVGICTHLGCSPSQKLTAGVDSGMGSDWPGGFFCPCHGSKFDLAGRVFKGVPAPINLEVPPYAYLSDTRLIIGSDSKGA